MVNPPLISDSYTSCRTTLHASIPLTSDLLGSFFTPAGRLQTICRTSGGHHYRRQVRQQDRRLQELSNAQRQGNHRFRYWFVSLFILNHIITILFFTVKLPRFFFRFSRNYEKKESDWTLHNKRTGRTETFDTEKLYKIFLHQ